VFYGYTKNLICQAGRDLRMTFIRLDANMKSSQWILSRCMTVHWQNFQRAASRAIEKWRRKYPSCRLRLTLIVSCVGG